MSEQGYRSVFAILGLVAGLTLMYLIGIRGMVFGAVFGAGGAVAGGMFGEHLARRRGP